MLIVPRAIPKVKICGIAGTTENGGMAKSEERVKARAMRRAGESIKVIAKQLGVSKSSVSHWCEEIILSPEQVAALDMRKLTHGYRGRLIGARSQRERKLHRIEELKQKGISQIGHITINNLLLVGLGLYMGEGRKSDDTFQFTNSNPDFVMFIIRWLELCFGVSRSDMYCRILINDIHQPRTIAVSLRWSELLHIPLEQFRKTIFIKTKNKKVYENYDVHLGTLALRVRKCSDLQRRILGLTHGLVYNLSVQMPA